MTLAIPRRFIAAGEFHLNLRRIKQRREDGVLREHKPGRRRIRIVRFAGFPVPALITRCRCCNAIWPCRELITVLRTRYGWTRKLDRALSLLRKNLDVTPATIDRQ